MLVYSFYAELLTRTEEVKARLTEAISGSLVYNQASVSHAGGTIHAETLPNQVINLDEQSDRMRVYFNDSGTTTLMGTYLIAAPDVKYTLGTDSALGTGPRQIFDFVLLDKVTILHEFSYPYAFTVKKGANTVTTVRNIIKAATGESDSSIIYKASTKVLREERVWDIGTTALSIINDLLASIDYWAVRCDESGKFLVVPYVAPGSRAIEHTFTGSNPIHTDEWSRTREIASVPNRFTVYSTGTEETKGYTGVARNQTASSPFSYQARGRWIDQVESVPEFASQADATKYAERRLRDVSDPVSMITFKHAFKPMRLHDRIQFRWQDTNTTGTVYNMNINLGTPDLMTTAIREII